LLALVFALVTASTGMDNLIQAVSLAYDEKESRPWYRRRVLALLFVGGAIVVLGGVVAVSALVPHLVADAPVVVRIAVPAVFWLGLAVVVMLSLSAVYRYAPDRKDAQWAWVSWGAVLATVTWVVVSFGFFVYVSAFGSYNRTYGALAGVVVTLLWLLLSSLAVLLGAEINAEMEKQTAYDTTTGPERPMGSRGAFVADNAAPYPDNNSRP
jgi:membrane protein